MQSIFAGDLLLCVYKIVVQKIYLVLKMRCKSKVFIWKLLYLLDYPGYLAKFLVYTKNIYTTINLISIYYKYYLVAWNLLWNTSYARAIAKFLWSQIQKHLSVSRHIKISHQSNKTTFNGSIDKSVDVNWEWYLIYSESVILSCHYSFHSLHMMTRHISIWA